MINLLIKTRCKILVFFIFYTISPLYSQISITTEGNQSFCANTPIKIVTNFSISNPTSTPISEFFIQISSGYQNGFDALKLSTPTNHPTIIENWNATEGKLTLTSSISGSDMTLLDIKKAVDDVVFITNATILEAEKIFSLTVDKANYLPLTGHFYEFVPDVGITWNEALRAAEKRVFYGRSGYLATLTSEEEATFAGEQASGAGWIGGSDEGNESIWKWMTGPEKGTIFWSGWVNGSSPTYANWNIGEPNDVGGNEDYAHITDATVGNAGSWNDLPNEGGNDEFEPKGYIVEYGKPGDPELNNVATTRIYLPQIVSVTATSVCESGTSILTASTLTNEGEIVWFNDEFGGVELGRGNGFETEIITSDKTFYAAIYLNGCITTARTLVTATVMSRPQILNLKNDIVCSGSANLSATASTGTVFWYDSLTSSTPIFEGENFTTPILTQTTSYFVEAINLGCKSTSRTEIIAEVDTTIPSFNLEKSNYILCNNIGEVTLKTINPSGVDTYIWLKETSVLSETSSELTVNNPGVYSVKAVSSAGCISFEQTITVNKSEIASITSKDVLIIDNSANNSIQVINTNLGIGDYEFSLDDEFGTYTDLGLFENIKTGTHSLFIKDKGGCGITEYVFSILEYPSFFTPNNDGKNDLWHIRGVDENYYTLSEISIFNRFGVLVYVLSPSSKGWDGTYNGTILPSNSYWFKTSLTDKNGLTIEKSGSFSLLRK